MATPNDIRIDPTPEEFVGAARRSLGRVETYFTVVSLVPTTPAVSTADISPTTLPASSTF